RGETERGHAAEHEHHGIGRSDQTVAAIADGIANQQQHRRPHERRGDIGEPEAAARHPHDARRERYYRPHRAKEPANKDTLAAVLTEKLDTPRQEVWIAIKRPDAA